MPTPREIIKMEYGDSRNFMTPKILGYGKITYNVVYEFSQGEGLNHETIYGISVVEYNPKTKTTRRLTDLSKMFYTHRGAVNYIKRLKKDFAKGKISVHEGEILYA